MPPPSSRPHRRLAHRAIRNTDVCSICGGLLDKTLKAPHPMSAVADHILPRKHYPHLALDPQNIRAAHARCNRLKSDKVDYVATPPPSEDW